MSSKKGLSCRRFYSLPENPSRSTRKFSGSCRKREDIAKLVKYVDDNVIGKSVTFSGPYGRRKVNVPLNMPTAQRLAKSLECFPGHTRSKTDIKIVYCDYGSSGRSLQFIEDYILKEVLPGCGEIHNASSITSLQSTIFRHEANGIVRTCVNASDDDEIIFASHGSSGALKKLIELLDFQEPPVVFVGPSEQQSTLQPWKQLGAKIVRISESKEGFLDLDDLETQLLAHQGWGVQLIGCFSAASSITGILADDVATTLLLHQHGALAIWDYATAASFVTLDMNPTLPGMGEHAVHKDAICFSAQQFLGGVQTPGILIVKKRLLKNTVPSLFKGDELTCACKGNQKCLQESEAVEEESASDLVQIVRAGLVMQLKEAVGVPAIMSRAEKITRMVLAHIRNIPELILLGNSSHSLRRLPTFSFVVRHPRGTFLHHNFVCSVLNDIFGIQASAAYVCVGPYSQDLMGIDNKLAEEYEKVLLEKKKDDDNEEYSSYEILRPGFSRICLPYCINESDLGFILEALKMVATEAWKLLPQYIMVPETAEWRHHSNSVFRDKKWLSCVRYVEGRMIIHERKISAQGTSPADYAECLHVARSIFNKARKIAQRYPQTLQRYVFSDRVDPLRWFMLPSEAHNLLLGNSQNVKHKVPFDPIRYTGCKGDPLEVNIAKMFSGEGRAKVVNDKTSASDVQSTISNCPVTDKSQPNNSVLVSNTVCMQNNLSPKTPNHLQPERQNSFSSDISNSDCSFEVSNFQQNSNYSGNVYSSYVGMCQSPVRTYPETLCYSPQPLTSPVLNQTDLTSHFVIQHTNYGLNQPTNYGNYCGTTVANSYDNNYNNPYLEKCPKIMNSKSNYCGMEHANGKMENYYPPNKVHFALGPNETSTRQRCNSLGSSLILNPKSRASLGISCRSLTDGEASLNVSECSLSSNEDIHAYVTEVTKELATEIKSEIREVISKVEDVLSESVDNENCGYSLSDHRGSRSLEARSSVSEKLERTNSLPSATASDIAQYLMGVSKEMAEEMKSEIRGLVSSVVSPDISPIPDNKKSKKVTIDMSEEVKGTSSELKKCDMTKSEDISQSRDSGINLSYSETNIEPKGKEKEAGEEKIGSYSDSVRDRSESLDSFQENEKTVRCRSESLDSLQGNDDSDAVGKFEFPKRKTSRGSKKMDKNFSKNNFSGESSNDEGMNLDVCSQPKWHCPSKAVWKPTIEAIEEFDMVKNGDKILICLSSGRYCLSLLHALYQYRFHACPRGVKFELGVILGSSKNEHDDGSLLSYLDALGVSCLDEDLLDEEQNIRDDNLVCSSCARIKQTHLLTIAKNKEFNVIAFDQHLDDVAENFLTSAFYNGKLTSVKAHYFSTAKDIRIIRPFVYVREKALRQFSESRYLPATSRNCAKCLDIPKERHRSRQLLAQQESAFPRLFASLKTALHPLISSRHADQPYSYTVDSDEVSLP